MGFLSRRCNGEGPHLALRGESPGLSRVVAGNFGFLSSCDTDLKPTPVASGMSSPHSSCEGPLGIPLQSVQGHTASSQIEARTSGCLFSSDMDLGVPMEFQQGSQAPSRVEIWNSASLSRFQRGVRLPVEWTQGSKAFSRGATGLCVLSGSSGFQSSPCRGIRLIWSGWGNWGLFELRHDCWGCAGVSRGDRPPPEGRRQHRDSFPEEAGESALISLEEGENGALLELWREIGGPL